jgi:MSHA biogenesis protein MshI
MAQRNLALLMPQEASGILFITFGTHDGLITLSKQGEIYLTRRVDTGLDLLTAEGDTTVYYDRVVLEIQRSLDYYDSYFRQPPISSVVLAPATSELQPLADYLRANLNSNVEIFDPSAWLDWPAPGDAPLSGDSLLVLGAALRREEGA